jgi:hypothetical protein
MIHTLYKGCLLTGLLILPFLSQAQMPHDHIYMNKKQLCIAAVFGQSTWSEYWENTLKRENLNIGTHTTQSAMLMAAYGYRQTNTER